MTLIGWETLAKRNEECGVGLHGARRFCLFIIQVAARRLRVASEVYTKWTQPVVKHVAERGGGCKLYACATRISIHNSAGWLAGAREKSKCVCVRYSHLWCHCAPWVLSARRKLPPLERCRRASERSEWERGLSEGYPRFCGAIAHTNADDLIKIRCVVRAPEINFHSICAMNGALQMRCWIVQAAVQLIYFLLNTLLSIIQRKLASTNNTFQYFCQLVLLLQKKW